MSIFYDLLIMIGSIYEKKICRDRLENYKRKFGSLIFMHRLHEFSHNPQFQILSKASAEQPSR
jgi:hypothetical protein